MTFVDVITDIFLVIVTVIFCGVVLSFIIGFFAQFCPWNYAFTVAPARTRVAPDDQPTPQQTPIAPQIPIASYRKPMPPRIIPHKCNNDQCSICLETIKKNDIRSQCVKCNNCFHKKCLDTWLQNHNTCPLCRTDWIQF